MAKKLINRILGENRVGSKISEQDLIDYSIGAFLTDEENRTVWINGMPYGNAYISSSETRQPKHAEVFNDFDNNKAEGHYSHAEGGAYVNTVYNNTKITYHGETATYRYSVPYTNVLYKMIQVMARQDMNIPLYVVVNNEGRLDPKTYDETINDESNDIITNYDAEKQLLAIDKDGKPEETDYNGSEVNLENKVTSDEPIKYYIKNGGYTYDTDKKLIYFNVATSLESTAEPTNLPAYCDGKTMYFHYYYAYDGKDGWSEATKDGAHAEGVSQARGVMSHAEGFANRSYEDYSHTEGVGNEVYGLAAHAEGDRNIVTNSAPYSHAEGHMNIAKADSVHVEGRNNLGNNTGAHVEGGRNKVDGLYGHAEGYGNHVKGDYGHAEGTNTVNNGKSSHTEGIGTITLNECEHAEGKYNYTDIESGFISTVGIGSSDDDRKNAIAIDSNGLIYIVNTTEVLENNLTKFNPCMYDGLKLDKNTKSLQRVLSEYTESLKNVTYAEIRSYIDNKTLIPGKFYRIIDYCTTLSNKITHEYNIKSANNEFDIVVLALTNKSLSENAYAILRDTEISLKDQNIILENGNTITYSENYTLNSYTYNKSNGYYTGNGQVVLTNYNTVKLKKPKQLEVKSYNKTLLCSINTNDIENELLLVSNNNKKYIYNYPQIHGLLNGLTLDGAGIIDNYNINSFIEYSTLDLGNKVSITVNIESVDITIPSTAEITSGSTYESDIIYHFTKNGTFLECTEIDYNKNFYWKDTSNERYLADYLSGLSGVKNCSKVLGTYNGFYMYNHVCTLICVQNLDGKYIIESIDFPSNTSYFNVKLNGIVYDADKTIENSITYDSIDAIINTIEIINSANLNRHAFNSKLLYFYNSSGNQKTAYISFTSDDEKTAENENLTYKYDYSSDENYSLTLSEEPSIIFPEITKISGNIPSFLSKANVENSIGFYNSENPFNLQSWKLKYDINNTALQTQASITEFYSYCDDESVKLPNSLLYFNRSVLNIKGITNNFNSDVNTWFIVNNSSLTLDLEAFKSYRYILNQIYPQDTETNPAILYSILTNNIYALSENDETYKGILCQSDNLTDLKTPDEDNNDVFVTNDFKNAIFQAVTAMSAPASFYTSLIDYYDEFGYATNNKNWLIKSSNYSVVNTNIKNKTCYVQTKRIENNDSYLYLLYEYIEKNATKIDASKYQINTDSTNLSYITYENKQYFLLSTYYNDQYNIDLNIDQVSALEYKNTNVKNIIYEDSNGNKLKYYVYVALDKVNFENYNITTENITINDFTNGILIDGNFSSNIKLNNSYLIAAVVEDSVNDNFDIYRHNNIPCIYRIYKDKIYNSAFYTSFDSFPDFYIADDIFDSSISPILTKNGIVEKWNVLYYDLESVKYNDKQYNLSAIEYNWYKNLFNYNTFTYNQLNYLDQNYTIYKNENENNFNLLSNWFNENETDTKITTLLNTYNYFTNQLNTISFALFEEYSNISGEKISAKYSPIHKYNFLQILEKIERPYKTIKYHIPFYFAKGNIYGFIDEYNNSFGYDPTNIKFLGEYNKYYYTFNVKTGSGNSATEDNALRFGNIRNNRFSVLDINSNTGGIFDKIIINCRSTENLYAVNNDFSDIVSMQINATNGIKINNSKFTNINTTVFENSTKSTINIENSIFANLMNAKMKADNYNGVILNDIDNSVEYKGSYMIQPEINPIFALSNFRIYSNNTTTDIKNSGLYNTSLTISKNTASSFVVTYSPETNTSFNVYIRTNGESNDAWNSMYNASEIKYTITLPATGENNAYILESKKYIKLGYLDCCTHYYYNWHRYNDSKYAPDIHLKLKPTITVTGAYNGTYSFSYDTVNVQNASEKTTYDRTLSSLIALDVSLLTLESGTSISEYNGNTYLKTTADINVNITIPADGYYCGAQNDTKTTGIDIKLSDITFTPISATAPTVRASNINVVNVFNDNGNGRTLKTSNLQYKATSASGTITKYNYSTSGTDSLVAVCKDGVIVKAGSGKYVITTTDTTDGKNIINTDYFGKNGATEDITSHIVP